MKFFVRFIWSLVGLLVFSVLFALTCKSGITLTVNDQAYHVVLKSH